MKILTPKHCLFLVCLICLCGCATPRHLVGGAVRPASEVVTVVLSNEDLAGHAQIWEGGQWVPLGNGSQVLPGRQFVHFTLRRDIGSLANPNIGFVNVSSSFTASAGDTVTYCEAPDHARPKAKDDLVYFTLKSPAGEAQITP